MKKGMELPAGQASGALTVLGESLPKGPFLPAAGSLRPGLGLTPAPAAVGLLLLSLHRQKPGTLHKLQLPHPKPSHRSCSFPVLEKCLLMVKKDTEENRVALDVHPMRRADPWESTLVLSGPGSAGSSASAGSSPWLQGFLEFGAMRSEDARSSQGLQEGQGPRPALACGAPDATGLPATATTSAHHTLSLPLSHLCSQVGINIHVTLL